MSPSLPSPPLSPLSAKNIRWCRKGERGRRQALRGKRKDRQCRFCCTLDPLYIGYTVHALDPLYIGYTVHWIHCTLDTLYIGYAVPWIRSTAEHMIIYPLSHHGPIGSVYICLGSIVTAVHICTSPQHLPVCLGRIHAIHLIPSRPDDGLESHHCHMGPPACLDGGGGAGAGHMDALLHVWVI